MTGLGKPHPSRPWRVAVQSGRANQVRQPGKTCKVGRSSQVWPGQANHGADETNTAGSRISGPAGNLYPIRKPEMSGDCPGPIPNFIARPVVTRTRQETREVCEALAGSISDIEKHHLLLEDKAASGLHVAFGIDAIDRALDPRTRRGIAASGLHEVRVAVGLDAASGAGFALCLGILLAKGIRAASAQNRISDDSQPEKIAPIFWISDDFTRREYGSFYDPGLAIFGLAPQDLVRIHPKSHEETLWAAGEIAATRGAASLCLIEISGHPKQMDLTATRRLMLRAGASGTPVILLRQSGEEEASAATTRWHVKPAISQNVDLEKTPKLIMPLKRQFIGPPAFYVQLEKCRGGSADETTRWNLEWTPDEQRFSLIRPGHNAASSIAGQQQSAIA